MNNEKTIISLFDYSGNWSKPYKQNGYNIIQVDIKLGIDVFNWYYKKIQNVYGILAAVPCTDYALCGAKYFKEKDLKGITNNSNKLVNKTKEIIDYFKPNLKFWVIENPMSRIHKLNPWLGNVKYKFNPCDFAKYDPQPKNSQYNKMTWLWGDFNNPIPKPLPALITGLKWKDQFTKKDRQEKRSITPLGFAYAFYLSNK
jgi:hypothetical protein